MPARVELVSKKTLRAVLVLVLLAAAGWILRLTLFAPKPVAVAVAAVERGRVEETATNSRAGTVKARRRAKLAPEIGGRVAEIPHREGAPVKAGEVLIRLGDELQRAQLTVAERQLEAARAESERACLAAELASRELARNRPLAADGIVPADVLDRLENEAHTTEASCRTTRVQAEQAAAELALARTELAKTVLRSPFDGVVAEVSTEVGEYSTPSPPGLPMPPVIDVLDPTSIYISAPMDEVDSARIKVGQTARLTVDSFPGRTFQAHVVRVAPYVLDIEEQNRTVEIEVELDDPAEALQLLPGTSADVEVILGERDGVLRIPTQALMDRSRVLALETEGEETRLVERGVEAGLRNWDYTEITGGLAEGDQVATSLDREGVHAGALVTVEPSGGEDGGGSSGEAGESGR
jgi:HlyD family secretion protein